MSASHRYWVIPDTDAAIGAAMRAAGAGIVPGGLLTAQGAAGDLAMVKVRAEACGAPPDGVTCRDLAAWTAYSQTGPWVRRAEQDPVWTGTERGCLVPEADATEAHAVSAGGLAYCPRVEVEGVMCRLVRYTGAKPPVLSAFATLYPADVAALLGGA